jgi:hypothetical protein
MHLVMLEQGMAAPERAGFKRGSIVRHPKYGLCYVGGFMARPTKKQPERKVISLHCLKTGKRLTQNALPTDIKFLSYNSWRVTGVKTLASCSSMVFKPWFPQFPEIFK